MNCHQVLSGACNAGDRCFAVGSVEGIPFTAYAAGCNIVILASTFERVQIIPGATHGYIKISAIDCSTDTGKISAAYDSKICIFEPTPVIQIDKSYSHCLDYRWVQTASFISHSYVISLSWNLEGTRLLTGGSTLQLWKEKSSNKTNAEDDGVKFVIGEKETKAAVDEAVTWDDIWSCKTAIPIYHMAFSPDGTLFATCGRNDRLVKIWYENDQVLFPGKTTKNFQDNASEENHLNFTYIYIAHPRAVTNISWRKTSKYMPKGSVSNMIVTSCLDNICRIWIETLLPDDGLVNLTQFDPLVSQNPKFRTHRHKHRFMQRLKHMKTCFHIRRHVKNSVLINTLASVLDENNYSSPIPSLPSSCSVHDFHSYGFHGTGVAPGMHFHLSAAINAETDIPLVPSMQSVASNQNYFILHWLNNKEMHFTIQAESILQEFTKKILDDENSKGNETKDQIPITIPESTKSKLTNAYKSISIEESYSDDYSSGKNSCQNNKTQNINSMSNTTSLNSLNNENTPSQHLSDSLDIKIDCLLRDWHQSPDLLFSIHPVDGSYLIWVIEWLEDYYPGSFRQAQVSFSTRIPTAFPLGDAMSMSTMVSLYNTGFHPLVFKEIVKTAKNKSCDETKETPSNENLINIEKIDLFSDHYEKKNNTESERNEINRETDVLSTTSSPTVSMVTKHSNGTLNLWQLTFSYKTKFTQVLSISHVSRASGHRFRVNDITCHPVLPLLLSTSHHNLPEEINSASPPEKYTNSNKDVFSPSGFCSELILWRVDAVGPLSHSGGVSELARINSPEISAFSNVAWIPTLLPSTTLGSYSNSPSACFVASDGENLRVYQAVIDARTLLAEISESDNITTLPQTSSNTSLYSNASSVNNKTCKLFLHEKIKVVSQQSTARPGCIIQLDTISEAKHDWQNTQFLHVFQAQLITGGSYKNFISRPNNSQNSLQGLFESEVDAIVDLQQNAEFKEPFYIVIIEKTIKGSTIHMWRIIISSKPQTLSLSDSDMYVPDSNITQEFDDTDIRFQKLSIDNIAAKAPTEAPHITIITKKMCTQELPLPEGVDVIHASPAAGHLSSSSIYPACFAPYIIVTACSDSVSRFWKCEPIPYRNDDNHSNSFEWSEWKMFSRQQHSAIEVPGQPLNISAAYSGRIACAYKYGKSFTRPNKGNPESRYINLCVAIYECESTGGSKWVLEDTINLRNIYLPSINADHGIDLSYLHDNRVLQRKKRINQVIQTFTHEEIRGTRSGEIIPDFGTKSSSGLLAVPSFSTLQSLRKSIAENGNTCPLTQKHLVQLDWVSKEDGSHILTIAVGSKILLFTPVSSDIAQANMKAMKESRSANRPILRKASSLAHPHFNDEIRWMKLRQIDLKTADGLPPLPMQMSWVRDGILVVGMDSEMHVYSQWKPQYAQNYSVEDLLDTRNLRDEDLRSFANESTPLIFQSVSSVPLITKMSGANLQYISADKKKKVGCSSTGNVQNATKSIRTHGYMTDYGLFQASRIACPVLPQYHPKQLMELLNCGKVRWVKAILAHLVRCMNGSHMKDLRNDEETARQRSWSRSRTMSFSYAAGSNTPIENNGVTTQIPEELMLDYAEITSIPPLPLWVLLTADKEVPGQVISKENVKDYNELFETDTYEDTLDDLLGGESDQRRIERQQCLPEKQSLSHFGLRQGQILSRLLTHTHLPGLSSLDQMHLLALADTVASCNKDFSEKFASDHSKNVNKDYTGNMPTDSLDDCGLRFLLAMKHFTYLLRCLPLNQRAQYQKNGVGTSNIVWAFHSESEEELLHLIPSYTKGELKWITLKELGVGYWLRNITVLKQCMDKLAKSAYQSRQDPLDAALYYLAMKKKSIVWGLFRSKRDEKMTAFFANNFVEDRWRKAALKNAFVLLGKQRFEHAAAFFLLANSLNDAIEVCINKLEDFQLALVISRLYEGDLDISTPSTYRQLLCEHILGCNAECNHTDNGKAHPDPFLRSIGYWILKKYAESLNTLLETGVGQNHYDFKEEHLLKNENHATNPNVFNFYIYLRTHPLLIRQNIALSAQEKKITQVVLSGFSYSGDIDEKALSDKQLQIEDTITPLERQLYFTTAHGHFKAGCPALALEVLNKLPTKVIDSNVSGGETPVDIKNEKLISTGTLDWISSNKNIGTTADWSQPEKKINETSSIEWDDKEVNNSCYMDEVKKSEAPKEKPCFNVVENRNDFKIDIMSQQLKFVACLKILMEELSTLATGFEVDGGQLRYQLYVWLEKEVDALKQLCNYCNSEKKTFEEIQNMEFKKETDKGICAPKTEKPSLHDILVQEKQEFEAKVMRAARRKQWLKANETLLRTLLSYCSLHGAGGGGLASVRMELVLLLQELQQEKTQQQLLSPLPFPTTLPLLSACVAGNKTVIADPIKFLQSQTQDMLQCIQNTSPIPGPKMSNICEIFVLRDLSIALSSCIYQSLCDSESFIVNKPVSNGFHSPGIENIAKLNASYECSYLMGNANIYHRKRKYSTEEPTSICTLPSKWPGVTNLRSLIAREKDEDIPKLNVLLLESFVATYLSLFVFALATSDSRILYRIVGHKLSNETWSTIFGGGIRKLLRKATSQNTKVESFEEIPDENSVWNTVTSITKQRVKLNMKLLGPFSGATTQCSMKEDKPTYREQFLPPEMSILTYLLSKPLDDLADDDYDTDDPIESEDDNDDEEEEFTEKKNSVNSHLKSSKENTEHSNPMSRSWIILRLALIKLSSKNLRDFINIAGIESQDLPVLSPLIHEVLRSLNRWQDILLEDLSGRGPTPDDFMPGCFFNTDIEGPAINTYRQLLEKQNTPFTSNACSGSVRRLWNFLVRQEDVQDVFIKIIYGTKLLREKARVSPFFGFNDVFDNSAVQNDPIRIIHKDHESILAFCVNNNSSGQMSVANPREVQELDISLLLESPNWYEDEYDYDMLNMTKEMGNTSSSGFLVIHSQEKNPSGSLSNAADMSSNYPLSPGWQSGRGTSLVLKHKVDNVKRMSAHPHMPLYLTGGQDGSVQIWKWGHQQVVCTPRPSGTFAKVTRCRFSEQGNKFGITDGDGNISLWQAGIASQNNRSFFAHQCHNKGTFDFVFLGACSLIATAGHNSENKNVCIWDTLLPISKSCVTSFSCHDQGASSLVFAPQHQILISCGKKGDVCIFDVKQRILRHRYQAHDSAIKCLAMDPNEEYFVTGSTEGDIKIWNLNNFAPLNVFPGEHAKNSFFKHTGQGVSQLHVDSFGRLFSCGSDGCMKVRQLIEKETIVHSIY